MSDKKEISNLAQGEGGERCQCGHTKKSHRFHNQLMCMDRECYCCQFEPAVAEPAKEKSNAKGNSDTEANNSTATITTETRSREGTEQSGDLERAEGRPAQVAEPAKGQAVIQMPIIDSQSNDWQDGYKTGFQDAEAIYKEKK